MCSSRERIEFQDYLCLGGVATEMGNAYFLLKIQTERIFLTIFCSSNNHSLKLQNLHLILKAMQTYNNLLGKERSSTCGLTVNNNDTKMFSYGQIIDFLYKRTLEYLKVAHIHLFYKIFQPKYQLKFLYRHLQ